MLFCSRKRHDCCRMVSSLAVSTDQEIGLVFESSTNRGCTAFAAAVACLRWTPCHNVATAKAAGSSRIVPIRMDAIDFVFFEVPSGSDSIFS